MPILPNEDAQAVANTEGGNDFDPIPPGIYNVRLLEVEGGKSGPAGEYWVWTVEVVDPEHAKRRLWINTSLSEKARWKLKETFTAFGYTPDTDTDEMVGRAYARAKVVHRPIQQGERAGELRAECDSLAPVADGWTIDGVDKEPF